MKDAIAKLCTTKDVIKNSTLRLDCEQKVDAMKATIKKHEAELLELEHDISLNERKKVIHTTDILKSKMLAEMNEERYITENNKHLENCQEQVKLEAMIYNIEDEIEALKGAIKELKCKLDENKDCLHDKIFLELIKGLGVEYNESDKSFVVRNTVKNQICTYKATEKDLTDKIWKFLDIE